ncbi:MAG: VWA domain-containing protein [Pyrinomonadaceae bacterium]
MKPFRFSLASIFRNSFCLQLASLTLCFVALTATTARAQNDEPPIRIETNLVQLNVGVADQQGRPVTNLSRGDFAVYEDNVRQSIVSFEPVQKPFSLVLLLDVSGSTITFRTQLRQAALRFIESLGPEDRVAVVAFNDKTKLLTNFTADRRKIAYAIEIADGRGETQFYRALDFALGKLAGEEQRRKAIVVMTDGVDSSLRRADRMAISNSQTNAEAIASIRPEANPMLGAVLAAADRQNVTIFPLALPSGDVKRIPFPDAAQTAIYKSARTRLQTLADRTGGRLNEINRLEDLARLYAVVAADLRTLYTIAYQPPTTRPRDGSFRAVRIEVARPELIARTRPGYYAR